MVNGNNQFREFLQGSGVDDDRYFFGRPVDEARIELARAIEIIGNRRRGHATERIRAATERSAAASELVALVERGRGAV